ncbi:DUF4270 domain-containing protein [Seonamhaeicola marinus]|uniref:DUF4270 domain-containing protein n=1 Tax=Seonamhaeicola marinus TaxID=1912246 RepID=A0A5D0HGY0_9FLAO|nr:DUF4270 domain-containing protein [Seonamhaeicola marinus]TYA70190.1 DUF4270 domain-containing protein [Seonamhaeicola marinus]
MKKIFETLRVPAIAIILITSFVACDKDFYVLDSDVLGKDNANFDTGAKEHPVVSYNKRLKGLQVNNLPSNLLGFFNDPDFGTTTASIVTDITPSSYDPDFGDNPVIDSVILRIPYFSRVIGTDSDGFNVYTISDSLYGAANMPIKLSIYENGYFLRDLDPNNLDENQKYYSHNNAGSTDNYAQTENNLINFDDLSSVNPIMTNDAITFSDKIVVTKTESDTTRFAPSLRLKLGDLDDDEPYSYWQNKIIFKEGQAELSNASNFKNYFRGLYFKAEAMNNNGSMIMLNFNSTDAGITIYYQRDDESNAGERVNASFSFNFAGNRLNTFNNDYSAPLNDGDTNNGDETLYLKGTEGSMAIVDLFPTENDLKAFLDEYRVPISDTEYLIDNTTGDFILRKLINEAHLVIYEDNAKITAGLRNDEDYHKYDRLYAFDVKNSTFLVDYATDITDNVTNPVNSKIIHSTRRDTVPGEYKYKIRLTEHLNDLLLKDSLNTKIGLVLSTNVNFVSNATTLDENNSVPENLKVENVPSASVITPKGTILFGNNIPDTDPNYNKRLRLKIFATEPK